MTELEQLRQEQLNNLLNSDNLISEKGEINISDYLRIFSRRRWSILALWLGVMAVAFIYNFLATEIFSSRASIIIKVGSPSTLLRTRETTITPYLSTRTDFKTKTKLITSRPILAKAGEKLVAQGYFRPADFENMSPDAKQAHYKKVGGRLGGKIGYTEVEQTNLVYISCIDTDPRQAAAIANAVAEAMVNYNAMEQEMTALNSLKFLNQQLEDARQRLGQAESKMYEYKQKNQIFETQVDKNQLAEQRANLDDQLQEVETSIAVLDAHISALRGLLARKDFSRYTSPASAVSVASEGDQGSGGEQGQSVSTQGADLVLTSLSGQLVQAEIEYGMLIQRYKESHPEVIAAQERIGLLKWKFEEELKKILTRMEMQRNILSAKRDKISRDIAVANQKIMEINSKDAEYVVLERETNSAKELFNSLLAAVKEANIQANGSFKDLIYIHEYAMPVTSPIKPNRLLNLMIAAIMGLVLGGGWAVLVEVMDRSIRTPEDVEFHARIPILSLLPHLEEELSKERTPIITDRPRSLYSEGILHLRANLRLILSHYKISSFIITSCSPKEGKSMIAANLSLSMAQEGIRTLLIDADLRRPVQHKLFGLDREMGLTRAIIDMFQNPDWKNDLSQMSFGDLHLLLRLQKTSGLATLRLNSGHPLKLLYQNGSIIAGNIKDWKNTERAGLEDVSPEEIKLEFSESGGQHHILPALATKDVDDFFGEFPVMATPSFFSYNLFEKYTYPVHVDGLRVMPSGPIPSNPGEILGSAHFRAIIDMLKPKFDLIIYDGAPCWPLSDVSMLSQVAQGIVFLVRANRISRDILLRNLQMLKMLNFRIMGAVFNDFDIKKEKYYYGSYYHYHYYYYYYYYYSYGYGTEEGEKS